ncbi:MAG: PQQ-binding-like beta-propeller repeat protein [Gemmataceae bacterium]
MPKLTAALLALSLATPVFADDWPQFRGPTGDGHYRGPALPLRWGPDTNVVWKKAVPGLGWSSPVVWKGRVYLTTAVEDDRGYSLRAVALDAATGDARWSTELFREETGKAPKPHAKNSHASPTPVADDARLYVHFGHMGTAALNYDGTVAWRNSELKYEPVHGNGGSPVLIAGKLIFTADGGDTQRVVALDAATGKVAWQVPRGVGAKKGFSFATPEIIQIDGKPQVVCPGSDVMAAYDPADGREVWRVTYKGYSLIQRPVFGHGLVFLQTGYDTPNLLAVRPGTGDVTATNVAWTHKKAVPNTPSYLLVGDELLMISDRGIATCFDAKTGKVHYSERLPGGGFSASPIFHDGKAYVTSEDGLGLVLQTGPAFKVLAQNPMKERSLASFAAADGALYVRTAEALYKFGAK